VDIELRTYPRFYLFLRRPFSFSAAALVSALVAGGRLVSGGSLAWLFGGAALVAGGALVCGGGRLVGGAALVSGGCLAGSALGGRFGVFPIVPGGLGRFSVTGRTAWRLRLSRFSRGGRRSRRLRTLRLLRILRFRSALSGGLLLSIGGRRGSRG
jgi:hypothetical protein